MVLTFVIATYADKVFSDRSMSSYDAPSQLRNALLPCPPFLATSKASVMGLSPVELSVQSCLTSELLRFL
jgi:hypothetical protein